MTRPRETGRCEVLVGRRGELATLTERLDSAERGRGSVIVVIGEPGVGKSRLVQEVAGLAATRSVPTYLGRATAEGAEVELRPWCEVLLSMAREHLWPATPALASYRASLAVMVPDWRTADWREPAEPPVVIGEAILRLVGALTPGGALVCLEDLHWSDPATLLVLDHVAAHAAVAPAVFVVTVRDDRRGDEVLARLRRVGARELRTQRLDPQGAAEMVRRCLGATGETAVEAILARAEGLPLVIEDLAFSAGVGGRPARFADSVRARVAGLEDTAARCLQVASLLGERVEWRHVVRAAGVEEAAGAAALQAVLAAGLLVSGHEGVRFRHALTRQVISDDVLPHERRLLQARIAEALLADGPGPYARDALAVELLLAAGEPRQAMVVALAASDTAEANGELQWAAAGGELAYEIASRDHHPEAAGIGLRLADLRLALGDTETAIGLLTELLGQAEGHRRDHVAASHVRLARAQLARGAWELAEDHLRHARLDPSLGASAEIALLEAECAFEADRPGQRAAVEHQAARAAALAAGSNDLALRCEALLLMGRAARTRDLAASANALEEALTVAEQSGSPHRRVRVLDELGTVEMLRDARADRLERAYREALRLGVFGAAVSAGLNLASAYLMTGRHRRCIELATEVRESAERLGLVPLSAACSLMAGCAHAFDGDRDRAEPLLRGAEALAPHDADLRSGAWAIGRGVAALVYGERDRARAAFERSAAAAPERHARILDAALGPRLLLDATEGAASSAVVLRALRSEVANARWTQLWLGAAFATALAQEGDEARATVELGAALRAGERYPLFGSIVRTLVAGPARDTGFADPVELLRQAAASFEGLGLGVAVAQTRAQLKALGQAAPRRRANEPILPLAFSRAGVTAREAEILPLLVLRLTNRQIAERLYVSPKTVEKHVASLLLKFAMPDRHQLAEHVRTISEQ